MRTNLLQFIDKLIWLSYLALAIITPLIFSTKNTELFEVPKMIFVYFFAIVIFSTTLIKFILREKITIPKSWPLLSLIIFVAVQTLSTFTSIDKFTSIFGYPSRLNGGLLSQFAYITIFVGALVNLNLKAARHLLIAIVASALAVALWGIPSHFGYDPSCLVLSGNLDAACWQKEFNPMLRIFSTLGQPNWLASYLVLIIPISLALALTSKKTLRALYLAITIVIFLATILTTSRAGALGMLASFVIFIALLGTKLYRKNVKFLGVVVVIFMILAGLFGKTLFFRINEFINPTKNTVGGTESGQIRLIVWQGAVKAFEKKPLLGYGPETIAYSYYLFRPLDHNQTTEWSFFYNKAHNEFINYLANIGIFGLFAYLAFLTFSARSLLGNFASKNDEITNKGIVAAVIGYQITIFFGFSVVASQLVMYLLIAIGLIRQKNNTIDFKLPLLSNSSKYFLLGLSAILFTILISFPIRLFFADLFFARAKSSGSLKMYQNAIATFPSNNPFYLAEFAIETATYSKNENDDKSASKADLLAQKTQVLAPDNLIIIRRIATTYVLIADFNKNYITRGIEAASTLIKLAPTDPQSYLTQAKVYASADQKDNAKKSIIKALELKPEYVEAQELLEQL